MTAHAKASASAALELARMQVEELGRRTSGFAVERTQSPTPRDENTFVVVSGSRRCLEPADAVTWSPAESPLFAQIATESDQVPDGHYLVDVDYNPLVPTWFGVSSNVHEATWSTSRFPVVVKRLREERQGDADRLVHERIYIDGLTRRRLNHPNIVKFLGVFREDNDGRERLAFVFVKMEGHLLGFLQSTHYNPRVDRKRLLIEIASALVYLHGLGIVHGNLSLVLVERGRAFLNAGSFAVSDGNTSRPGAFRSGAVQYMAPEFLFSYAEDAWNANWFGDDETLEPTSLPARTAEGDVFAYGRLIFAIAIKDNPFGAVNDAVVLGKTRLGHPRERPPAPTCHGAPMSDSLWELTRACWQMEPEKRPTMQDVLRSLSSPGFDA